MLRVAEIHKDYDGKPLLKGISFEVRQGELVCLLGSSGSGKSTMLRIIAGLENPESGKVYWNNEDYTQKPTHERGFGLMFQDYALFPHRSVAENIAFGLRLAGHSKAEVEPLVGKALESIHMQEFADRPVTELSGGEQQRVALARALAPDPHLLMLDEPLGALDHNLRTELLQDLRKRLHESRKPVIYVTHDQEEAFALADRLLLLHDGKLVQEGTPEIVFNQPANAWVASFLGLGNLVPAKLISANIVETKIGQIELENESELELGSECMLLLRPQEALIGEAAVGMHNHLRAVVQDVIFQGEYYRLEALVGNTLLQVHSDHDLEVGQTLDIAWSAKKLQCLPLS
ncbi:MAG: ABC transporter ATP-binding protein [Anaerolineaceae bacterium]|jgi:ABC-type Fe3+/spermidine/putrescine transport system ATPase subunit|nr:ABC transporter ATP-binding protein [Anaerolineaceae bacterium]MDD4043410.1 ABC transporter ATP-binding protein [Anaerolineaceae bacterium]MDD4578006.1 ABC transporter ATP-binding protein [Anaerolineaceae bacterium]